MSGLLAPAVGSARRRDGLLRAELGLLAVATAALAAFAVLVLVTPSTFDLPAPDADLGRLLAATAVYAVSHVVRVLRLVVLLRSPALQLRRVAQVHLLTAGISVLLPFKLGDLVRIREVGVVAGSWRTGLLAVWLERALDAAVLAVLVLVAAVGVDSLEPVAPFLVLGGAFVLATAVAIAVLPENIRALMLHIVRRPFGERSVPVLRALRATLDALHEAPSLLRGRVLTLLVLTALIWIAEVVVVGLAVPGAGADLSELTRAMLSLLSGVSAGAAPLMPASGDHLMDALRDFDVSAAIGTYRLVLTLPVLLAGAAAAAGYLTWRVRR